MDIDPEKLQIHKTREGTRTWLAKVIAYTFVGIFLIAILVSVFAKIPFENFNAVISTFATLFGVVIGFYFGKDAN